jgi:hypothetical protein
MKIQEKTKDKKKQTPQGKGKQQGKGDKKEPPKIFGIPLW